MQLKHGKIIGSALAFLTSEAVTVGSLAVFPPLAIPMLGVSIYTLQKFANNTYFKSFKDLAFIARQKGDSMKIYQDSLRVDILHKAGKLDMREKLGFLQLQTLVGMSKFGNTDKKGNPLLIETDTHDVVRKTLQKLERLGYIENYNEKLIGKTRLLGEKLAFGNTDVKKKVNKYNIKFQRTDKQIDFEDAELQKMFPGVLGSRGIIKKQGYNIIRGENGELIIDYGKRRGKNISQENIKPEDSKKVISEEKSFKERVKTPISLEEQRKFVERINTENRQTKDEVSEDIEKE